MEPPSPPSSLSPSPDHRHEPLWLAAVGGGDIVGLVQASFEVRRSPGERWVGGLEAWVWVSARNTENFLGNAHKRTDLWAVPPGGLRRAGTPSLPAEAGLHGKLRRYEVGGEGG